VRTARWQSWHLYNKRTWWYSNWSICSSNDELQPQNVDIYWASFLCYAVCTNSCFGFDLWIDENDNSSNTLSWISSLSIYVQSFEYILFTEIQRNFRLQINSISIITPVSWIEGIIHVVYLYILRRILTLLPKEMCHRHNI
jgi:hypothetical protein